MKFTETVAVYCENHTEHTDTVRTSQETHYVSLTENNLLMMFMETVADCCKKHTENTDTMSAEYIFFLMLIHVVHVVTTVLKLKENKWVFLSSDESTAWASICILSGDQLWLHKARL
jgi:hypothetical protein